MQWTFSPSWFSDSLRHSIHAMEIIVLSNRILAMRPLEWYKDARWWSFEVVPFFFWFGWAWIVNGILHFWSILPILWPSSTCARPCKVTLSEALALNPWSTCSTSHCLSCDVKRDTFPSSSFICSKQWLSRVVKSRKAPPKSCRSRLGSRYSSAAL